MGRYGLLLLSVLLGLALNLAVVMPNDLRIPLFGLNDQFYAINLTIGTPPLLFMLTLDMRAKWLVLAAPQLPGFGHRQRFNTSKSRTFFPMLSYNASDGTSNHLRGSDRVEVGPLNPSLAMPC